MRPFILLVCFFASVALHAQDSYPLGHDSQVQSVPHGTVEKLVLPPGQFFPGTPHNYAVYIPANAPAGPLPYMVFLDGAQYLGNGIRTATVLDNLIAAKAIPPMVGVFVDPGVLPAIRSDAQNRYERVFEYDSLSNRYSRFLLEELLPAVAKKHALSTNPDEHAIGGTSTGAVGAFVAAWHRPDQFHRVLSLIGTYVAMKGADTLPEIVRKTEAKPIRIWMQDGANDHLTAAEPYGTFFAGTWPLANQAMFNALQFQGYDAKLTIGTGAHDTKQGGAELPDALRWLWRDYSPEKGVGKIGVHAPAALGEKGWDTRGSVWATVEGVGNWEPVSKINKEGDVGELTIADNGDPIVGNDDAHLMRVTATGVQSLPGLRPFSMVAGDGDELYGVAWPLKFTKQWIEGNPTDGPIHAPVVLARGELRGFSWAGNGRIYFVRRRTEIAVKNKSPATYRVSEIGWMNTVQAGERIQAVHSPIEAPESLALSPDKAMLVITDPNHRHQWSMQLQADGTPVNAEPFYRLEVLDEESGATGATFDSLGQVYFATAIGIQVCEANGRTAMILNSPIADKPVSSIAFGGPDRDWLYAVADGKLFRRKMKVHAVPVDKPEKPPQPPL
jgi:gluconolactonase